MAHDNPYAPPEAPIGEPPPVAGNVTEAEVIRRKYINYESSVRSIGSLHFIAAIFGLVGAIASLLINSIGGNRGGLRPSEGVFYSAVFVVLNGALGFGLDRLKTWARKVEAALTAFAFLAFLVLIGYATIFGPGLPGAILLGVFGVIPGYVLYLLLSRKGTVVFSRPYQDVIAQTPHIKYRSGCLLGALLILLGVPVVAAIVAAMLRAGR